VLSIAAASALVGTLSFLCQTEVTLTALTVRTHTAGQQKSAAFENYSLADVILAAQNERTVFIDVRDAASYKRGHIPRALSAPLADGAGALVSLAREITSAPSVVVYCADATCGGAALAATLLLENGCDNVKVYVQGFDEWRGCKLAIEVAPDAKAR
jgi:rhodanese-related sulfurtransferase